MVVENFHTVISFKQSKWLEKYISSNTQEQNIARNDFAKDFCKLSIDEFYGKTMENVRHRIEKSYQKRWCW